MKSDPYATLGVPKDADKKTIKRAYRKRVKKVHSDKGGDDEAFMAVQRAYEILYDDDARARFDKTGDTKPPRDLETLAIEQLGLLAIQAVSNMSSVDRIDLVKAMKETAQGTIEALEKEKQGLKRKADKFRDAAARFTRKTGENFMEAILASQAGKVEISLATTEENIALLTRAFELLCQFEYKCKTEPVNFGCWEAFADAHFDKKPLRVEDFLFIPK